MDLVGRTVVNQYGVIFRVADLSVDANTGAIAVDLLRLDEEDQPIPGTELSILNLDGWRVL